ncbi:MAG: hypothetical protein MJY67_00495 [Bacteroidales bacterium]|nr:hypothetical protein [Bacteroidales bacterium]
MRRLFPDRISILIAFLTLVSCWGAYAQTGPDTQGKISRKEQRRQAIEQAVQEILGTIQGRHFSIDLHSTTHSVSGVQMNMDNLNRHPDITFRPDGIMILVPYFTGNTPLDGVTKDDIFNATVRDNRRIMLTPIYPHTWIDCTIPYPDDFTVTREKEKVKMTFSSELDEGGVYFFSFVFFKKNCDFSIDCKSFTKTDYRGHLITHE